MLRRSSGSLVLLIVGILLTAFALRGQASVAGQELPYRVIAPQLACDTCGHVPSPLHFRVDFLDVGQGDAALVTVGTHRMLIDGGPNATLVLERLQSLGVTDIDVIVATHQDADHVTGLYIVLQAYAVERIY